MIRIHKNLSTKLLNMVNKSKLSPSRFYTFFHKALSKQASCLLCDEETRHHHLPFQRVFCEPCLLDFPSNKTKCSICCLPLPKNNTEAPVWHLMCGECLANPPSFTTTICPFTYDFPIKPIIKQIKYAKQRHWIKPLSWLFKQEYLSILNRGDTVKPDLLIPVPIHKAKKKQRGYNQSALLSRQLSYFMEIASSEDILIKTKHTQTQTRLNKFERIQNLTGSFNIAKKALKQNRLKGKHIALVDDVMTTKATAEIISKLLLEHGAMRVDIWCLARTPKSA